MIPLCSRHLDHNVAGGNKDDLPVCQFETKSKDETQPKEGSLAAALFLQVELASLCNIFVNSLPVHWKVRSLPVYKVSDCFIMCANAYTYRP